MAFLLALVRRRRRRSRRGEEKKKEKQKNLLLLLLLLTSLLQLLLLLTFVFSNSQICFTWGRLGFMECTILLVLPCCLWKLVWICMSIWICCWKLVCGYVYMDMLDFVELCCWIWSNMLLNMLLDMLDMYACISVFETMSN